MQVRNVKQERIESMASFYLKSHIDFENKTVVKCADNALFCRSKPESSIVLDARDDSGGSLSTVVDIADYSLKEGPIVQTNLGGIRKEA
jgi:C-terminal processing protease CtpA/Prc